MEHPDRNFDGIQFESYRKKVDAKFNKAHDELENCYYKYWREGRSKPFQGYDVQPTKKESKALFDKLHGLLWHEYTLAMKAHHDSAVTKEQKFDRYYTEKRTDKTGKEMPSTVEKAQVEKQKLNDEGIIITVA